MPDVLTLYTITLTDPEQYDTSCSRSAESIGIGDRKQFEPGATSVTVRVPKHQAQSVMNELDIQGIVPFSRPRAGTEDAGLYIPPTSPADVQPDPRVLNRAAEWAMGIGCLVLSWVVLVTWLVEHWN